MSVFISYPIVSNFFFMLMILMFFISSLMSVADRVLVLS